MKKRLLLGILALVTTASLTACGGGSNSSSYGLSKYAAEESMASEAAYDYSDDLYEIAEEAPAEAESASEEVTVADSRKIIKTVNIDAETEEFDKFISNVETKVVALGGYVEQSNIGGNSLKNKNSLRYANITARIPAKKLDDFVTNIDANSNITNKNLSAEDVTLSYSDTQEHLNSLRTEQERLDQLILEADDIDTIIVIEKRLTEIRYEIESYASRLRTMDNQVDYSTVYLSVSEVKEYTEPVVEELSFGQRIAKGLKESFHNLGEDLADFIVGLIVALPYIIVFLFFTTIFVFLCAKFIQLIIWLCSSPQGRVERKVKREERKVKTQEKAAELKKKLEEKKAEKEAAKVKKVADSAEENK